MPLLKTDSKVAGLTPAATVVIPVFNASVHLRKCLQALERSTVWVECIVVDDASTDESCTVAIAAGATVLYTEKRTGPAHARNRGAIAAGSELLFFIDADVCVYPHTVERIIAAFEADPDLDGLIGSYDDSPEQQDFVSQYRNLLHHFVHQQSKQEACTFWSGCGAIRKACFLESGGFDTSFNRPAIEDIEFGYRLRRSNRRIRLDRDLQVKHLKEWSFPLLVRTDVFDRGIPWTELILRDSTFPNDLNLSIGQRLSVALVFILVTLVAASAAFAPKEFLAPVLALGGLLIGRYQVEVLLARRRKATAAVILFGAAVLLSSLWSSGIGISAAYFLGLGSLLWRQKFWSLSRTDLIVPARLCVVLYVAASLYVGTLLPLHGLPVLAGFVFTAIIALNRRFYSMLASKRGRVYALAVIPFHLLFHFYSGVAFLAGVAQHLVKVRSRMPVEESAKRFSSQTPTV